MDGMTAHSLRDDGRRASAVLRDAESRISLREVCRILRELVSAAHALDAPLTIPHGRRQITCE
jgi:hypothetical protein